jgi:periplasmic iron binding protein
MMLQRWRGPIVVLLILGGVVLILALNLNTKGWDSQPPRSPDTTHVDAVAPSTTSGPGDAKVSRPPAGFREYPIGEEVERNQMRIAAVWLPPVQMEGMAGPVPSDMIHLEADIRATEGNRNGFAKDEFVPYLVVHYTITSREGTDPSSASAPAPLTPMVARDGLHYGASIAMPKAGRYTLTYRIEPPSAGGLGRHSDPVTGVDPWWKPFVVSFNWDYEGPPKP